MRTIHAVDLFAGAGGTSTGLAQACKELGRKVDLTAINHWPEAIQTHEANHPWAKHLCQDIRMVDPEEVVPGLHIHILVASPECIYYSRAAGGRPKTNQHRATAWDILPWLERVRVDNLLVENVAEFADWGPLDAKGHPVKRLKGTIYDAWLRAIRAHGYNIGARVLNAADYGAATSRSRIFVIARKGNRPVDWPEPTHGRKANGVAKWRAAREIIDWGLKGESIFTRKRPLSEATIRRIVAGLRRFGGSQLQPFLVLMEHGGNVRDVGRPLPTITTARGGSMAVVDFTLSQGSGGAPRGVNDPLNTITTDGAVSLVESCLVPSHGEREGQKTRAHSTEAPVPAIAATGHIALAEGFILPVRGFHGGNTPKSLDGPLGTVTQRGYGHLVEPCIVKYYGSSTATSVDAPLDTVTTKDRFGLAEPYVLRLNGTDDAHVEASAKSIDQPLTAIVGSGMHIGLVQPEIDGMRLDIKFRMLQPHELSAAMGFPAGYQFKGNKTDVVMQIGNAVVVDVARALVKSLLSPPSSKPRLR